MEAIGEGVTSVKVGDHVVPGYTPQCKEPDCIFCMSEKSNLCTSPTTRRLAGLCGVACGVGCVGRPPDPRPPAPQCVSLAVAFVVCCPAHLPPKLPLISIVPFKLCWLCLCCCPLVAVVVVVVRLWCPGLSVLPTAVFVDSALVCAARCGLRAVVPSCRTRGGRRVVASCLCRFGPWPNCVCPCLCLLDLPPPSPTHKFSHQSNAGTCLCLRVPAVPRPPRL